MENNKYDSLQKVIMTLFSLLFLLSLLFFTWRLYTKSSYKEQELEQCRLLAVSTIETLACKMKREPNIWSKFNSKGIALNINHKSVPGNWLIVAMVKQLDDHTQIEATVCSGWNSRSPQKASYEAKVFERGNDILIAYKDNNAKIIAKKLLDSVIGDKKAVAVFSLSNGEKELPITIKADLFEYKYKEKSFLIMKLGD